MVYQNIFESGFELPERVCILAPGPSGRAHYREIPGGFLVIAVAKAVLIPGISADIWMMNHADQPWYQEADAWFEGIRIFGDEAAAKRPDCSNAGPHYYFEPEDEPLMPEMTNGIDGVVRLGGSITGCALQIAYNFGARQILLCGADMSGDGYWDGTLNSVVAHGETWSTIERLNPLIRWMKEKGVNVETLSPTKLDVPAYRSDSQ